MSTEIDSFRLPYKNGNVTVKFARTLWVSCYLHLRWYGPIVLITEHETRRMKFERAQQEFEYLKQQILLDALTPPHEDGFALSIYLRERRYLWTWEG